MLPELQHHVRGLVRRAQQRRLSARMEREIRWCGSIGGALSLVLLALPGKEFTPAVDDLIDRAQAWIAAAHPGALVSRVHSPAQIAALLPGAGLARAQQFCEQLRRPTYGLGSVGEYLYTCAQGVAGWEPGLSSADLQLRAESALMAALSGHAPVVLYHDSLPRPLGTPGVAWEDWSI